MSYFQPRHIFPGQHDDEKIYLVIRSHWLFLFFKLAFWLLMLIIYIVARVLIKKYLPQTLPSQLTWDAVTLAEDLYLILLLLGTFISWVIYYLNVQVITNERIVQITQRNLLSHVVSELHLSRVQDVTSKVEGLGTFFDFGNVYVQTAAEEERFDFRNVPHPTEIEKLISDLSDKLPPNQGLGNQPQNPQTINKTA